MTVVGASSDPELLRRRLRNLRSFGGDRPAAPGAIAPPRSGRDLAERLARCLGGEPVESAAGVHVRIDARPIELPVDRSLLARLPGGPPPDVPLVCLDTETTGLATATGTVVFLVGLGWWTGSAFRQSQLLLADHAEEGALLAALRDFLPPDAWLVTYNGRAFDWPLLVTRYRMAGHAPPPLGGHVDLLPFVRRVFRHRMPDARLRTVEREVLGLGRIGDIDGWEIPGRYLAFLRTGEADDLGDVVRHNHEDVRSLARLLAHAQGLAGGASERGWWHPGDLLGLARGYRRIGQFDEALACLDTALALSPAPERRTGDDLVMTRARLLRRLGRRAEALEAWETIAIARGRHSGVAWIEVAKLREHHRRDPAGALHATEEAARIAERARVLGTRLPLLEADVAHRRRRLRRRIAARTPRHGPTGPEAACGTAGG